MKLETLEEYKKHLEHFEVFDTPEKVQKLKDRYVKWAIHVEEEDFFEPFEPELGADIFGNYEKSLNRYFKFDTYDENTVHLLIIPSFTPETILRISSRETGFFAEMYTPKESVWGAVNDSVNPITFEINHNEISLREPLYLSLKRLFSNTIECSKIPTQKYGKLDGIQYRIGLRYRGENRIVYKHSPMESSQSHKICQLIDCIKDCIINKYSDFEDKLKEIIAEIEY
jgi:hypothetical protein